MKRNLLLLVYILISVNINHAFAQDTTVISKPKAEFSGFFRFDYWYDTRQNVEGLDGLLLYYPKAPLLDANGNDINASPSLNSLAMGTRLRTNITMPRLFNAKPTILVEVDFTGTNNAMVHLRFRHGYTKLVWDSGTELNVGLTWHPMFVTEVFPYVASLNTGAPFQSFNRSPQVTLKQPLGSNFKLILSALNQSDYKDYGPPSNAQSSTHLRNGVVPNLHAQLQMNVGAITAGFAIDFKSIKPKLYTTSLLAIPSADTNYVSNERVNGLTSMAYLKVQTGMLTAKFKGMLSQNMGDHLMLGGYAVSSIDSLTGNETYTPFNHAIVNANFTYGRSIMPGLFIGYAKNMGTSSELTTNTYYGRGVNVDYAYRVTPNFTYRNKTFAIMAEVEHTFAAIGKNDATNKGKVINSTSAANTRFLIMIQYDF
jgi:hypothetical protein